MANPGCEKNVASAAFGVSMVDLDGADKTPKIVSPFASSLGNQFEFSLNEAINPLLAAGHQSGPDQDVPWPALARKIKNPTDDERFLIRYMITINSRATERLTVTELEFAEQDAGPVGLIAAHGQPVRSQFVDL